MSDMTNRAYLLNRQYHTAANLNARIQLHARFSTNPANWQRWVFEQLDIPQESRVLELGSGSGQLWRQNLDHLPADWEITLSDFSAGMLEETRESLQRESSRTFHFAIIDAQEIPYPTASFDSIIANHMLYHVPDRARALSEIRRVLHPEGYFYAATNGETHLREMRQLCVQAGINPGGVLGNEASSQFNLQNGSEQLAPWFRRIEIRRFSGDLAVTEAEPLVAFLCSAIPAEELQPERLAVLRRIIEQEIAQKGFVHITKETGIFIGSN